MLKIGSLFIFCTLLIGCHRYNKETDEIVFESHIEQILSAYLKENKRLNPQRNVIIVRCDDFYENKFRLTVLSEILENLDSSYEKDYISFGNYKEFKMIVIDQKHKLLKSEYRNISSSTNLYSDENIPVTYNGVFWSLNIRDGSIMDFSYQFCEPDTSVIRQIKSISIPADW
ncbi:hypothetical protein EYV94_27670 [Puteibacter caeruleilacunae]|nr:hypothetical protein EYV94_27670 [Puteibacter caeruleilacunae]